MVNPTWVVQTITLSRQARPTFCDPKAFQHSLSPPREVPPTEPE